MEVLSTDMASGGLYCRSGHNGNDSQAHYQTGYSLIFCLGIKDAENLMISFFEPFKSL